MELSRVKVEEEIREIVEGQIRVELVNQGSNLVFNSVKIELQVKERQKHSGVVY